MTILTQSSTSPTDAPTTSIATGVYSAICSSENFVTAAPPIHTTRTTTVIGSASRQFILRRLVALSVEAFRLPS